jgi:cytochrome P450 family 6
MVLINILLFFVLPVATLVYFFFNRKFQYFKDRNIPHIKPTFPMGNLSGIGSKHHFVDIIHDIYKQCKGKDVIAGLYNFHQPIYLITDVEMIKNVVIKDFNSFINRGGFVNEKDEPLTGHLFALGGEKWRFLRNKLSPAFTSGKMKGMYYTIGDKGQAFIKCLEESVNKNKAVNIKDITNKLTIDIVSSVAFGMESNTMMGEHPELTNFFKEIFGGAGGLAMLHFFFMMTFPEFSKLLKMKLFSKNTSDFFMNVVGGNIEHREKTNDKKQDFLNMLIQLKNKGAIDGEFSTENRKITLGEVMAQAFVFFFAGADASSTTISLALAELAHNVECQEKLRAEIIEKTKGDNGELTYENIQEMTYLNQVMNGKMPKSFKFPSFNDNEPLQSRSACFQMALF